MNLFDSPAVVPLVSVFGGWVVGALSSMVSALVFERGRELVEFVYRSFSKLVGLFSVLFFESSRVLVSSVEH